MTADHSFSLFLCVALMFAAAHDFRHLRVPNLVNIAIFAGGVVYWLITYPDLLGTQLMAAAAFGASIWLLREVHAQLSGRIGLGLGDVKLSTAGAVWINPLLLPLFLFVASLSGLAFAIARGVMQGGNLRQERIPFAPFLGASILFCWLLERWP